MNALNAVEPFRAESFEVGNLMARDAVIWQIVIKFILGLFGGV